MSHNGQCYVVLPAHVHGRSPMLSLAAGTPPVPGAATVFHSFQSEDSLIGMDLSIAEVTGGLDGRCGDSFADLPDDVSAVLADGGAVQVRYVSGGGTVQWMQAQVAQLTMTEITIEVTDPGTATDLWSGRSGGLIMAGDTPVGMLLQAEDPTRGRALRMDAIKDQLRRLLAPRKRPQEDAATEAPASGTSQNGLSGLAMTITACSGDGMTPETGCWALADGSGPLVIPPDALPFEIEITLAVPAALASVEILSGGDAGVAAKSVRLERRAGSANRPSWKPLSKGDGSVSGAYRADLGAGQRLAGIKVTIESGWDPDQPITITAIRAASN